MIWYRVVQVSDTLRKAAKDGHDNADTYAKNASDYVDGLSQGVQENAQPFADDASKKITETASGVAKSAPELADRASEQVDSTAGAVKKQAPEIGEKAAGVSICCSLSPLSSLSAQCWWLSCTCCPCSCRSSRLVLLELNKVLTLCPRLSAS